MYYYSCDVRCPTELSTGTINFFEIIAINHISSLTPTDGSPVNNVCRRHPPVQTNQQPLGIIYSSLQRDIDAIQDCISTSHLTLNPQKCKYLICSRKRSPNLPPTVLLLTGVALEEVESYHYLGVLVSSRLTWLDHITQTCIKQES